MPDGGLFFSDTMLAGESFVLHHRAGSCVGSIDLSQGVCAHGVRAGLVLLRAGDFLRSNVFCDHPGAYGMSECACMSGSSAPMALGRSRNHCRFYDTMCFHDDSSDVRPRRWCGSRREGGLCCCSDDVCPDCRGSQGGESI